MDINDLANAAPDVLRPRIDISSAEELQRWAARLGVSPAQVVAAVATYGSAADAVEYGLNSMRGIAAVQR
jgi:Protein of unknown function (DUF3606)